MLTTADLYCCVYEGCRLMNLIKEYTFTVVSVCVVIAIIRKITSAHFTTTVINVVCGIVLSLAIISPVIKINQNNS